MPEAVLFGGCNGAGKTTLAFHLLKDGLQLFEFVNADEIARGLNPMNPYAQAGLASRLSIQRVNALVEARASFAFEGTLSGKWQAKVLKQCNSLGYQTRLIYVWLPSSDLAIERVAQRVKQGGHDVAVELIERRYSAGIKNFQELYLPLASEVYVLDGTSLSLDQSDQTIAYKKEDTLYVVQNQKWERICQSIQ